MGKETCSLEETFNNDSEGMMKQEAKDNLFEVILKICVMSMMIRMRGGKASFDVKLKDFKELLKDPSVKYWVSKIENAKDPKTK